MKIFSTILLITGWVIIGIGIMQFLSYPSPESAVQATQIAVSHTNWLLTGIAFILTGLAVRNK